MIWQEVKGWPDENIFLFFSYSVWHPQQCYSLLGPSADSWIVTGLSYDVTWEWGWRRKDLHVNEHISRNLFNLSLAAYHLFSPWLGLGHVVGNGTWDCQLGWGTEVPIGTDDVQTWGLIQIFMWESPRMKTIERVEGRGRKNVERCEKTNDCFILLLRMTLLKPSE